MDDNDYNYFVRCVNRFKNLLEYKEPKLFIMTYINLENIDENIKNEIIEFNNKFSKYTSNYIILVIFQIQNKKKQYHHFTHVDNIHFLELHTLSHSNGVIFVSDLDTKYFNNILYKNYQFNIL